MLNKAKEQESIEILSDLEICELHEAFNIFDIDSNGSIETSQLGILMNFLKQNPSKEELTQIIKETDIDNTNKIYFNQFLKIMAKRIKNKKDDEDKDLCNIFNRLDRNHNGYISIHEIEFIATHFGENVTKEDIEGMMKEADTDRDGYISLEEFKMIMKN